jgi:hypothetical protein
MMHSSKKWELSELSQAMARAIFQKAHSRFIRQEGDVVKFNGFWRDGDKQNVCAWLDKASWHDAKTGEGGGCKEFAKIAFNLTLPEFMKFYGNTKPKHITIKEHKSFKALEPGYVDGTWRELSKRDLKRNDHAAIWLIEKRGFNSPRQLIGSGFANLGLEDLEIFGPQHHKLIQHRLALGQQIIAPLRGLSSDQVQNLFFRSMGECPKEEKSRLLTGAGGWSDPDGSPRAFGFPYLINDFPNLVLCEGMADYFAAECLLDGEEKYLPLGASNAAALATWAEWLVKSQYKGRVTWIYQLDTDYQGKINASGPGQLGAIRAHKILSTANIASKLFEWPTFLREVARIKQIPNDLAQIFSITDYDNTILGPIFLKILIGKIKR